MNTERLLQHYERIADAPGAIARLRRFILDLAVRGKLVPQDANDEPAIELLKRIAKEKARAGKREKVEAEIDNEEELGDLPQTWRAVPLIALGSWAIGSGFPKNEQGLENGPHFFLKVSDMNLPGNEKYITTSNNFIDDNAAQRMRAKIHPPGTIIFPKIGGAIATNKRRILTRGSAIDNNCLGITFSSALNVEWAHLLLTTLDFTRYQAGTAVPALQQGVLERIPVGLPPLAEQHRIVAKVDELMGLCDRLEAARQAREATRDRLAAASLARLDAPDSETFQADARFALNALPALTTRPDQIKRLRQTILNLVVRGKLVPQDPNDEPASELLRRIGKDKVRLMKAGEIKRAEAVADLTASIPDFPAPSGWAITNLQSICNSVTDGDHLPPPKAEMGIPFLVIGNVRSQQIEFEGSRFVPQSYYEALDPIRRPSSGDLLYTLVGSYGIPVIVRDDQPFCVQRHIGILRPSTLVDVKFLARAMESRFVFDQATACATGIAQKTVPLSGLRRLLIPLPPLAEQHRIVAKVDALMALCDRLEASLDATAATRRRLLDALLAEALAPVDASELEAAE